MTLRVQAESTALGKQLESQHPERNAIDPRLIPLEQHVSGPVRPALLVLACAVGVVMLIVCANLSNLQWARLGTRQKEMALRAALGAGRLRLSAADAYGDRGALVLRRGVGTACSHWPALVNWRISMHSTFLCSKALGSMGARWFSPCWRRSLAACFLACCRRCGLRRSLLVKACKMPAVDRAAASGMPGSAMGWWFPRLAFACILLVGAGLLIRSFLRVLDVNLGFQPERAAALRIDPSFRISSFRSRTLLSTRCCVGARSVPGILAAGITDVLPLGGDRGWTVEAVGQVYGKGHPPPEPFIRVVSDGYFEAAGIPLRSGRTFTERDRAMSEPVVVINETMARTLWPTQNPLGQMITVDGKTFVDVVGVVADVHHEALEKASGSEIYLAMRQTPDYAAMQLVVRTALPPDSVAAGLRTALRPIDPNLPVRDFVNLQDLVDRAVSPRRFLVLLLAGFAGFALILASLGIYAVISFSVSQRVQEIGIRMALGASPRDVQISIVLRTLAMAELGLVLGMAGSRALANGLGSLLFGITTGDPVTFYRSGNASDRSCGNRWVYSRLESIQDRSDGCIAVELSEANERVRIAEAYGL